MTHEHLDHVQGPFYCAEELGKTFKAKQVWLTGSANPDYYDTHPQAKKQKKAALAALRAATVRLRAAPDASPFAASMLANNDVLSTAKCVDFLRTKLAKPETVRYVDRTTDLIEDPAGQVGQAHALGPRGGHGRVLRQVRGARRQPAHR